MLCSRMNSKITGLARFAHEKSPRKGAVSVLSRIQESELSPEPLTLTPVMVPPRR